ncbi:MAG TPA: hypothetical protein VF836_08835, partial [Gemmatimonadaceae bacterium]
PLRRYARLVGAPNSAPSLRSVAGLLLALALESGYEDTLPPSRSSIGTAPGGGGGRFAGGGHCSQPFVRAGGSETCRGYY